MLNETWKSFEEDVTNADSGWVTSKLTSLPGYDCHWKVRSSTRGGGVAILVKSHLSSKLISAAIKDTLIVKILVGRSHYLHVATSYFPSTTEAKWQKRFDKLHQELLNQCSATNLENLIVAADWNKNILEDLAVTEKLNELGFTVADTTYDWSYNTGNRFSKIDFIVASKNLKVSKASGIRSLSDHKLIAIEIEDICEIPKNKVKVLNRRLATLITRESLQDITSVEEFFEKHRVEISSKRKNKWIKLKPDESYKQELRDMAEKCDFHIDLVKKELQERWDETWKELNKVRFSIRQKEFFRKLKVLTKYSNFEKRDGSIINKIDADGEIVTNTKEVNKLLKETMQELCGEEQKSSFRVRDTFPHLEPLSITELKALVASISRSKALADDMVEDSTLLESLESSNILADVFTRLWDQEVTNSPAFQRSLTGRLIPLNKVHPKIPNRTQMRPIVGLSPIVKLIESRFKSKLDDYMINRMNASQTGFVRNCGTHVNIVRILKQCLARKQQKKRGPKGAILFIDFKSAYNNVNIEQLFTILRDKQILEHDEIEFLRALYSKTYISTGSERINIFKGVMQGSIISPALFNIFLDPLIEDISNELGVENVLAYADDLAVIVTSYYQLDQAIRRIEDWSKRTGVPYQLR